MKTNEKGFSLVVTLFVIVIFTTIGLSLMTLNFTNTKQINLTKEQQVATDLAEIGIIYYETLYTEHSFNVLNDAIKNTIKHIETLNKSKSPDAQVSINANTIFTHLILDRSNFIDKNIKINVNILDTSYDNFKITYQDLINDTPNEIKVTFISEGFTSNGKTAELTGNITLSIQQYIVDYLKGNPTSAVKLKEIPKIDAIENLKNINNECNSNSFNSLNNCKITKNVTTPNQSTYNGVVGVIEGTLEINNNSTVKDSIVYVKNNMTFNQSFDLTNSTFYSEGRGNFGNAGLNNTTLYVKNGGDFGNVNSGIVDSKVYSDGEFTFGNINSNHFIKNSEFIINGKFKMGNFNTLVQKSQFYVNGNVELQHFNTAGFKDSLIISSGNFVMDNLNSPIENSKIIVIGNFKSGNFNQQIDNTSVICAGSFSGGIIQYKNNNPTKKIYDSTSNSELFKEGGICSLPGSTGEESTPDPTSLLNHLDVTYN